MKDLSLRIEKSKESGLEILFHKEIQVVSCILLILFVFFKFEVIPL